MASEQLDSYTNEPLPPAWRSKIPGLMDPKPGFYRKEHRECSVQYHARATEAGTFELVRSGGWLYEPQSLGFWPSAAVVRHLTDWCLRNDASVQICLHWASQRNFEPFLELLSTLDILAEEFTHA